jgi:hypothetical protein
MTNNPDKVEKHKAAGIPRRGQDTGHHPAH